VLEAADLSRTAVDAAGLRALATAAAATLLRLVLVQCSGVTAEGLQCIQVRIDDLGENAWEPSEAGSCV
jgi:hypothetical protein